MLHVSGTGPGALDSSMVIEKLRNN